MSPEYGRLFRSDKAMHSCMRYHDVNGLTNSTRLIRMFGKYILRANRMIAPIDNNLIHLGITDGGEDFGESIFGSVVESIFLIVSKDSKKN